MRRRAAVAALTGLLAGVGGILAAAAPPPGGFAPDPPAQASPKQWVFDVSVRRGRVSLERARSVTLDAAVPTPRLMGRFAIELSRRGALLERVRFNAPLLGDDDGREPRRPFARPTFGDVTTHLRVQLADVPGATQVALVDRAAGELERFRWPPEPDGKLVAIPPPPPPSDAGLRDAPAGDALPPASDAAPHPLFAPPPADAAAPPR